MARVKTPPRAELIAAVMQDARNSSTAGMLFHQLIAERVGLGPTDHKCADLLMQEGPRTAGELVERTGLTSGAITGVIDRLELVGFVRRERDPADRRRVVVQPIQERLYAVLGPIFASLSEASATLLSTYSDAELRVIADFMHRSIAMMAEETAKLRATAPSPAGR